MMGSSEVLSAIRDKNAKFVDLRFTDPRGKWQHITVPASVIDEEFLKEGKMFDGSSIEGWQKIHQSDLAMKPDVSTLHLDPFYEDTTVSLCCDILDPQTGMGYSRCPRSIAKAAEAWLLSTGIADRAFFGPEPEFFMFDDVRWKTGMNEAFYRLDSEEGYWRSGQEIAGGNIGHRPNVKGGYFPVPPVDSSQDIRSAICLALESVGIKVEAHHHEVATANQCEVATSYGTPVCKADEMQWLKYIVQNVAHNYGKTATFMPKPLVGDNGNGMHCHQSLQKDGVNIFAGDKYAGLSDTALYYIGGIIRHARALNALTNPAINSYKRLVPGFEAPVLLAYSARNRSAAIRIPHCSNPKGRRIEVRFPDPMANPYLAFSAMMMAGIDGIQKRIHPGDPMDKDLYDLPPEELSDVPTVCSSLEQSLEYLEKDCEFLLQGDVFSREFLHSLIEARTKEIDAFRMLVHPYEFELYYSL
ncbi:type I glutamate--ammonia ligase [Legionella geestiana]